MAGDGQLEPLADPPNAGWLTEDDSGQPDSPAQPSENDSIEPPLAFFGPENVDPPAADYYDQSAEHPDDEYRDQAPDQPADDFDDQGSSQPDPDSPDPPITLRPAGPDELGQGYGAALTWSPQAQKPRLVEKPAKGDYWSSPQYSLPDDEPADSLPYVTLTDAPGQSAKTRAEKPAKERGQRTRSKKSSQAEQSGDPAQGPAQAPADAPAEDQAKPKAEPKIDPKSRLF
jgi:hypothetical protein